MNRDELQTMSAVHSSYTVVLFDKKKGIFGDKNNEKRFISVNVKSFVIKTHVGVSSSEILPEFLCQRAVRSHSDWTSPLGGSWK